MDGAGGVGPQTEAKWCRTCISPGSLLAEHRRGEGLLANCRTPNTTQHKSLSYKLPTNSSRIGTQKESKGIAGMALSRLLADSKFASPFPTEAQKELEKQWLGGKPTNNRTASAITAIV